MKYVLAALFPRSGERCTRRELIASHVLSVVLMVVAGGLAAVTGVADGLGLVLLTFVGGVVWGTIRVRRNGLGR